MTISTLLRTVLTSAVGVALASTLAACTGGDTPDDDTVDDTSGPLSPPVLSSFVLDAGTESPQDVRVAVHGVRRIEGATVLDWSVTPLASDSAKAGDDVGQELDINVQPALDNSSALALIDTAAKKVYRPLDNDDRANGEHEIAGCLCVPWYAIKNELTVGRTRLMQAAFPELPASLSSITVSIRNQPLVDGAPVSPEGEVPTGDAVDLNAPANEPPTAGPSATFTYPVADELNEPQQKMSLTINQVISGAAGTSLIYTVRAEQDGPGLDTIYGRPIDDGEVVPYGTVLQNYGSSGPGISLGAEADERVVRPWFATVQQKPERPPGVAEDFIWRECLCSYVQFYGTILGTTGRSITLIEQMPALPAGTSTVDIVFPDESLPPVTAVEVLPAELPATGSTKADVGTWAYGDVATGDAPEGWELDEWPTPVPDAASIKASDAVVDDLEEVYSTDVSIEKKEKKKVEVTLDSTVSFQPDSATLTAEAKSTLKAIAENITTTAPSGSTVLIEGHVAGTDQGSEDFQKALSQDRADAVLQALRASIDTDVTFEATGKGASEPVAPNDSEAHRKHNRRVVVTYVQ